MENLTKIETVATLAAIRAVINDSPGVRRLHSNHPLKTSEQKLEKNLKEFNNAE